MAKDPKPELKTSVAVIGAGHAGVEAALASARMGVDTVLFTLSLDGIANMPCNPSIGGTAKGHLVFEIDALGGEMGYAADRVTLQSRTLNLGKGAAVQSKRIQADRQKYHRLMKQTLENTPHLRVVQAEIVDIGTTREPLCVDPQNELARRVRERAQKAANDRTVASPAPFPTQKNADFAPRVGTNAANSAEPGKSDDRATKADFAATGGSYTPAERPNFAQDATKADFAGNCPVIASNPAEAAQNASITVSAREPARENACGSACGDHHEPASVEFAKTCGGQAKNTKLCVSNEADQPAGKTAACSDLETPDSSETEERLLSVAASCRENACVGQGPDGLTCEDVSTDLAGEGRPRAGQPSCEASAMAPDCAGLTANAECPALLRRKETPARAESATQPANADDRTQDNAPRRTDCNATDAAHAARAGGMAYTTSSNDMANTAHADRIAQPAVPVPTCFLSNVPLYVCEKINNHIEKEDIKNKKDGKTGCVAYENAESAENETESARKEAEPARKDAETARKEAEADGAEITGAEIYMGATENGTKAPAVGSPALEDPESPAWSEGRTPARQSTGFAWESAMILVEKCAKNPAEAENVKHQTAANGSAPQGSRRPSVALSSAESVSISAPFIERHIRQTEVREPLNAFHVKQSADDPGMFHVKQDESSRNEMFHVKHTESDEPSDENLPALRVCSVTTRLGEVWACDAVIVATGTYLSGAVFVGDVSYEAGPDGSLPAKGLSDALRSLGVRLVRFKTGTPARVQRRSINFSALEEQPDENEIIPYSVRTPEHALDHIPQIPCHIVYTNAETHRIIRENITRSAMYSGKIHGTGPRYCPSIEDKLVRFADKDRHQLFVEPLGEDTSEMYLQGFSTSLPTDVQHAMLRTLPGFEKAEIMRYAYAIEYDCADPTQMDASLQFKSVKGLFGAGQFNGTSGYEEAAAQGLVAGVNAAHLVCGLPPMILSRTESYIGTLLDDLVTKGTNEPYRMMTSRSEYRLLLRQDNADFRLTSIGYAAGLVTDAQFEAFEAKKTRIKTEKTRLERTYVSPEAANSFLLSLGETPLKSGASLADLLRRPLVTYEALASIDPERPQLSRAERMTVENDIKYEGYAARQLAEVRRQRHLEEKILPESIRYDQIKGLRIEAAQKLEKIRPRTVGQASRISGVNPADISVLLIYLGLH